MQTSSAGATNKPSVGQTIVLCGLPTRAITLASSATSAPSALSGFEFPFPPRRFSPRLRASAVIFPPSRPSRGVTLMEMLVVMAIIGLIVAVATPSVGAGIDSVRLVSATDSISAFLNSAVNYAERRQQPVELVISPKENRFAAYSNDGGLNRELTLPDGIQLTALQPPIPEDTDPVRRLVLMPGASVPGIGIEIANRRGARRSIRLDPMTGFPRVESVETK
jgi:prepilin-type N-terminal cleavage/methylation domain-containing protein